MVRLFTHWPIQRRVQAITACSLFISWTEAAQDIAQHSRLFQEDLRQVKDIPLPDDLKAALAEVEGELRQYVDSVQETAASVTLGAHVARAKNAAISGQI